jgi:hypothetical protein
MGPDRSVNQIFNPFQIFQTFFIAKNGFVPDKVLASVGVTKMLKCFRF